MADCPGFASTVLFVKRFVLLLSVLLALFPAKVSAHASMIAVTPANGAQLTALPPTVTMTFDGEIDSMTISAVIRSGPITAQPGNEIAYLETQTTGYQKEIVFTLPSDAPSGVTGPVVVHWRSIGLDGHQMEGYIPYEIGATSVSTTSTTAPATNSDSSSQPGATQDKESLSRDLLRAFLRFVSFVAASLVAGVLFLSRKRSLKVLDDHLDPLFKRISQTALAVLSLSAVILALLPLRSYMTGPAVTRAGFTQVVSSAGVFLWLALAGVAFASRKKRDLTLAVPAMLALASVGVSHAASAKWSSAALAFGFLHQAVLLAWVGPLLVLALLYYMSPIVKHDRFSTLYLKPLLSFSSMATTLVAIAVISGVRQVIGIFDGVPSVTTPGIGSWEALIYLKSALFLFVVAPLGLWHHMSLKRASSGLQDPPTLKRYIMVEAAALVLVAGVAALLAQTSI